MKNQLMKMTLALGLTATAAFTQTAPSRGPLVIDLRAGNIYDLGTTPNPTRVTPTYVMPYASVQVQPNPGCPETPFTARADMNFAPANQPAIQRAFISVAYEGGSQRAPNLPTGFATHIGDDMNNDGFGGGSTIDGVAEVQVNDQDLAVYSTGLSSGVVDRIAYQQLRLAKGTLRFEIANQFLGWGQPANAISTTFGRKLFAIGGPGANSQLYAAFNRVVRNGSPRTGCGARWAMIEFQ